MLETVKQAEDGNGVILRIYEYENALTKGRVSVNLEGVKGVEECNLLEEKIQDVPWDGNGFDIRMKPYEIKTYRLIMK